MADATIDSLAIEIGASSNDAVQSINRLSAALGNLRKSVSGGSGLSSLAKELKAFKKDLTELGKMKIDSSLSNSINKVSESINKLDIDKLKGLSSALQAIKGASNLELSVKGLGSLSRLNATVNTNPKAIRETTNQLTKISQLDFSNIDIAAKGIKQIAESAKIIMDSGEKAKEVPKSAGESVGEAMSQAAEQTQSKWRDATVKIVGHFARLESAQKELGKGINFPKLQKYIEDLQNADTEIKKLRDHIEELQSKMVGATDKQKEDLQSKIDITEESISKFTQSKADLQRAMQEDNKYAVFASVLKNVGGELKSIASRAIEAAKALGGKFLSAVKSAASAAGNLAKNIVTAPFNKLAQTVSSLKKQFDGLTSSFARVIFYRAVRTIIKEIGDAMKYGEENAYWFSKQFGTATKYISEAYDEYMSATEMMKNQIGAAWATLFANIQPIIEAITDLVTRAAAAVTQFFAALGGKTTYLNATKYAKDWKEETESATAAAKEWKNQILGFDEINRLDEQSDRGRNRASDNTPDYSQMFEEVAVESEIGDLANKMRDMWNNQRWKDLGNLIARTLNNLFPTAETWKKWGKKIGDGITGAVKTAYTAIKGISFGEWGETIGNGISFSLDAIDFETWGRLIVAKSKAAVDVAIGFLRGLDFKTVGASIGNFFRGAFDEGATWLDGYNWDAMGGELWNKIKSLLDGFDIPTFASSLGGFIVKAANAAAGFLNGIDFQNVIDTVIGSLKTFFDNLNIDDVQTAVSNLWEAIKTAFKNSMGEIGKWLKGKNEEGYFTQLGTDFSTGLTTLLEDADELLDSVPWDELGTAVSGFLEGIEWFELMKEVFSFVGGKIVDAAKWVFSEDGETVRNLGAAVLGLKLAFTGAEAGLSLAAQALVLKILNPFGKIAPGVEAATAAASGKLAGLKTAISTGLAGAKNAIVGALPAIGTAALGVFDVGLVAFDVYKLNQIAGEYNTAYEAHLNSTTVALESYNTLVSTKGKEVADNWAAMVYQVDLSGQDLESSQETLVDHVSKLWGDAPDNMWSGFSQGWNEYFGNNGQSIWSKLGNYWEGLKSEFGFGKSKKDTEAVGATIVDGMKTGVQNNMSEITTTIETELPKNVAAVDGAWESLTKSTDTAWSDIKDSVTTATSDINDASLSDSETLRDEITALYEEIGETIPETFDGVELTVTETMNRMADAVEKSVVRMNASFQKLPKVVNTVFREVQRTVQESIRSLQSAMNFQWSIPRPKVPRIIWRYDSVNYGDGNSVRIPQFDIRWFAKGGVLNNPTLFGMGDAGAEALVPLERNTQWISKVAREMNRQGASTNAASDDVSVIIYTAAAQIVQAINDSASRKGNVSVNVNGREFFRATYDDQQAVARERGVSLVVG